MYEDLIAKTRTGNMSPDDLQGATVTLTNPGGIGTVASVPRLMPGQGCIIATGAITPPPGVAGGDKVMTMTSTYDHRVIQGAESGAFLRRIEQLLQGEDDFYESVFESLGLTAPPLPKKEAAPAAATPAAAPVIAPSEELVSKEMLYHVQAATSLVKAHRMHGHLAARLDPLGSEPIGDPALEPETVGLTPEVMAQIPAEVLRIQVPGANARRGASRTCARPTAARSPTRSSTSPTTGSACGCGSGSSRASTGARCCPRRSCGSCGG